MQIISDKTILKLSRAIDKVFTRKSFYEYLIEIDLYSFGSVEEELNRFSSKIEVAQHVLRELNFFIASPSESQIETLTSILQETYDKVPYHLRAEIAETLKSEGYEVDENGNIEYLKDTDREHEEPKRKAANKKVIVSQGDYKVEGTYLKVPRNEAEKRLIERLEMADSFHQEVSAAESVYKLEEIHLSIEEWQSYNNTLLRRGLFIGDSIADIYALDCMDIREPIDGNLGELENKKVSLLRKIRTRMSAIRRIISQLEFYESPVEEKTIEKKEGEKVLKNKKVFVVHGRDEKTKYMVTAYLLQRGLEPIILHEQASQSKTVIEKIEKNSEVGYAVVLITPDDVGALRDEYEKDGTEKLKQRARQNVILELGYFLAKLGRENVAVLLAGNVEQPSDINGITYITMNDRGWETDLRTELLAAGYTLK